MAKNGQACRLCFNMIGNLRSAPICNDDHAAVTPSVVAPASRQFYKPVDLNDPHLLAQDGLTPSLEAWLATVSSQPMFKDISR
jgi:hypothetical protein